MDNESAGQLERLGTDAVKWAAEWVRVQGYPPLDCDEGTMIGWFANAIEAGRSAGRKETCPHTKDIFVSGELKICRVCGQDMSEGFEKVYDVNAIAVREEGEVGEYFLLTGVGTFPMPTFPCRAGHHHWLYRTGTYELHCEACDGKIHRDGTQTPSPTMAGQEDGRF